MPRLCCYCPGCKSGCTSDIKRRKMNGEKLPCLFRAPKDPNLFESWKKVIPLGDRELRPTDVVCSLHFKEEDINTHYEQKLTDGTIWRAPRGKASLKKGSIPSIFPNLSNYLSPVNKKRKLTTENNVKEKSESTTYSSQDKQSDIVGDNMKSCFVAGCKTGYKSDVNRLKKAGERIPSVFSAPKDPALFDLWQRAIPRADRKLSPKDVVCELHFKEEDIDAGSELKLFDGTIYRHEKLRKDLKPGVIPTIFSNVPGHSSYIKEQGKITKRKAKCKRKRRTKKLMNKTISPTKIEETTFSSCSVDQTINEDSVSDAQLVEENNALFSVPKSTQTIEEEFVVKNSNNFLQSFIDILTKYPESTHAFPVTEKEFIESHNKHFAVKPKLNEMDGEQFSFNFVKMNLHVIKKANSWWSVNDFENFIICARWNSDYITERKIVISDDLSYKVFIKEKEIKMLNNKIKLTSLKNISLIIHEVENIEVCKGIDLKNSNCYGFIQSGIVISRKKNLCINCVRTQNQYVKASQGLLKEEEIDCPEHVELLRVHFRY